MNTQPTIVIIGTLDTKGQEIGFLRDLIVSSGCSTTVIDVGVINPPTIRADISRETVAVAGGTPLAKLLENGDRRLAVSTMTSGAAAVVKDLFKKNGLSAIVALGGGTGTHIGTGVMRALPLGVPKLMVSTVASRDMSSLIGTKDIVVMHSVVDILGLNAVSRKILSHAASAIVAMAHNSWQIKADKPIVGMTSFGFITEAAMLVKQKLEERGYDVAPFHANGTGGMAMEDLVEQGIIKGVLDLALHEFADQLYGGYCGGIGPDRLEAAGRKGIPQLIVPGGLDCIVLEFDSPETMPANVKGRKVFWYDFRSGVRTSVEDVAVLARLIGNKLNQAKGPTKVMIPLKGWSEADIFGGPLYDPQINEKFVSELRSILSERIEVLEVNAHINEQAFAEAAVTEFDKLMQAGC